MSKDLFQITIDECKIICEMYGEPFLELNIFNSSYNGLCINIITTTTLDAKSMYDSSINIYEDGKVILSRNNGNWNGYRTEDISAIMAVDFLRSRGYEFKYKLPIKVERKIKLLNI